MADLTITAANVRITGTTTYERVQAGATALTQGEVVYLDAADNRYKPADSDNTAATAAGKGIVLTPTSSEDDYFLLATAGNIDIGATTTQGETYVVSNTAGGVAPIGDLGTGDYVTIIGVASDTAGTINLDFNATGVAKP